MSGWKPIETAPKDRTAILLFCPKAWDHMPDMVDGEIFEDGEMFCQQVVGFWCGEHGVDWLMANIEFCELPGKPTHWRKLMLPPSIHPRHVAGGVARAKKLSPERRIEIAQQAANARWRNNACKAGGGNA